MAKAIDWAGCIQKVKETVKSTLPDEDILDMLRRAKAAADRKKKLEGNLNDAEFIRDFANDNLNEAQRQALLRKLQQLNAIRAYRQRSTHVKMALKAGMSNFEATSSLTVTSYKSFAGAADSVEARQKAKSHQYGNVYNEIELRGYGELVRKATPEFERDFAIEKAILDGLKREGTGNKAAKEVAEIFHKYSEMARTDLNGLGADIGRLEGRIARQTHDRLKIKKYSYEEWRNDMLNWGDPKSFDWIDPDITPAAKEKLINEWLGQFHENVRTGVHNEVDASDFGTVKDIEQFKGPGNQAKKVSQSRKYHFDSPENWLAYNKKYGSGSVFSTLFQDLERSSKQYGLWSVWGVNPQAAFDNHLKQITGDLKAESTEIHNNASDLKKVDSNKELDKFRSQQKKLRNQFDQVSGAANIAVNPSLAAIGSTYRTITMLARLGGIAFSTFTDVPIKASVMRHNGIHVAQGTLDSITAYFKGLGPDEQKRFLSQFIVLHEGALGHFTSHLTEQGSFRGWMSKAHHFFGKYTGLEHITNGQRASMGMALTHNIAELADREFSKLDPKLQGNLIRYNIDQTSWDVLRKTKSEIINGKSFVGTDGVKELDLAEFTELARKDHPNFDNVTDVRQTKLLEQARDQLERRYRQYVVDQIDESVTKVGAREKAVMFGSTRPGTPEGEALRLFWQFKNFGLAYVNRHLRREFSRYGKVDIPGVVQLMVGTTFFGLAANAMSDISAGRIPRALNDPKTWLAAFIRGGGAGIYGDFLFGEYSRYGSSPLAVLSGPGIGNIESALRIMGNLRDGEGGKAGAEMFRLFKSHVPFQNLFYTKQVTDYLIFNQLLEVINPGYLKRTEDNLQKKYGQSYFLPPSSMVKEGGGFR